MDIKTNGAFRYLDWVEKEAGYILVSGKKEKIKELEFKEVGKEQNSLLGAVKIYIKTDKADYFIEDEGSFDLKDLKQRYRKDVLEKYPLTPDEMFKKD